MALAGWTDIGEMANMAKLIQDEEDRLFGLQVNQIKQIVNNHNNGLMLHSEFLSAIAATYAAA